MGWFNHQPVMNKCRCFQIFPIGPLRPFSVFVNLPVVGCGALLRWSTRKGRLLNGRNPVDTTGKTLVNNGKKSTNLNWLAPDFWTINRIQGFFDWFVLLGAIWLLYLYFCLTFQASQACHSIPRWPKSSLDSSCLTSSTTRQRSSSRCTTTRSPSALPGRWRSASVWVRAWNSCWPRNGLRHWGRRHMQSLRRQWRNEMARAKSDGDGKKHPHQRSRDRNSQDSQDHLTVAVKKGTPRLKLISKQKSTVWIFSVNGNPFRASTCMLFWVCVVIYLEKLPSLMIPRKTKKKQTGTVPRVFKKKGDLWFSRLRFGSLFTSCFNPPVAIDLHNCHPSRLKAVGFLIGKNLKI